MKRLWKWLALWAYRRWARGTPDKRMPVGVPGTRDPEHPCTGYAPRRRELGDFECWGDGHYLCRGEGRGTPACAHYEPPPADDTLCTVTGRPHRAVGGGDYGGSPPTICGDCGADFEDLSAAAFAAAE